MRLVALVTGCGVLAAHLLGCAQVAGIEDVSSSAATQHCVDMVNQLRSGAMLQPVTRWTDEEQCADQLAQAFVDSAVMPPACASNAHYDQFGDSFASGPDAFFQMWINGYWSGSTTHGSLGGTGLRQIACGYGSSGNKEGGAFLFTPRAAPLRSAPRSPRPRSAPRPSAARGPRRAAAPPSGGRTR
jgi:hypothetical protein